MVEGSDPDLCGRAIGPYYPQGHRVERGGRKKRSSTSKKDHESHRPWNGTHLSGRSGVEGEPIIHRSETWSPETEILTRLGLGDQQRIVVCDRNLFGRREKSTGTIRG